MDSVKPCKRCLDLGRTFSAAVECEADCQAKLAGLAAGQESLRHNYLKRTEAQRFEADKRGVAAKFKANLVWQGNA